MITPPGKYLFTSERLGYREWQEADVTPLTALNSDSEVMRYFPQTYDRAHTQSFIERMQAMQSQYGYCYYAVDRLEGRQFIGFVGLAYQTYDADFTPCTDVGWRLARQYWNQGYATEGAKACLSHATKTLHIPEVVAVASAVNLASIHVMQKAGMSYDSSFVHPALTSNPDLKNCVLYRYKTTLKHLLSDT